MIEEGVYIRVKYILESPRNRSCGSVSFQIVRIVGAQQWSRIRGPIIELLAEIVTWRIVVSCMVASARRKRRRRGRAAVSRLPYLLDRIGCCRRVVNRAQPDETSRRCPPMLSAFCGLGLFPLYWNIRPQHYGNYQGNGMSAKWVPRGG